MQDVETSNRLGQDATFKEGERRLIQCKNFRCMGEMGKDGKWRSPYTGAEVTDIVFIHPSPDNLAAVKQ